jgi:hypothetical protein
MLVFNVPEDVPSKLCQRWNAILSHDSVYAARPDREKQITDFFEALEIFLIEQGSFPSGGEHLDQAIQ